MDLDTGSISKKLEQQSQDASSSDLGNGLVESEDSANHMNVGSLNSDNNSNIDNNTGILNSDEEFDGDEYLEDDECDYDDNNEYYYEDDKDDYLMMQSQFDNVDLPAGVEMSMSIPWLQSSASSVNASASSSSGGHIHFGRGSNATLSYPAKLDGKETSSGPSEIKSLVTSPGTSTVPAGSGSSGELEENLIIQKLKGFKQFDTVEDFPEHYFKGLGFIQKQPPKNWGKRIQEEWKILEKDLPEAISVRACESRMELLRAVIGGPAGTPYHDGLFFLDCFFPEAYPNQPPLVYYYSGGVRLNPNLYECGKVCLSLLGTWSGKHNELWIPGQSTMLQVLVSIQALILNERPFFNEPGHDSLVGAEGHRRSTQYNEEVFVLSLKTMIYTMRRPPKFFEDLVSGHFYTRARDVLVTCKAYADGATVGNVTVKDGVAQVNEGDTNASDGFRKSVKQMINVLVTCFTKYASVECEDLRITV